MKKHLFFFLLIIAQGVMAQRTLTLQQAIDLALKQNFDILVSRHEADIDKANNTPGNAGMLPTAKLNATGTTGLFNVHQKQAAGNVNDYSSQWSIDGGASATLSWRLYDGGRISINRKRLGEIQSLGELQYKARVLQVMYQVIEAYYDIVRQKQQLSSIQEVIRYNQQRVTIAQTGWQAGSLAKTELLQAQIDLNVASENAIAQRYAIRQAQQALTTLLSQDAATPCDAIDSIPIAVLPEQSVILQKVEAHNADLLALRKQIDVARLALSEARKGSAPSLDMQGGLAFSQGYTSQGNLRHDRSYGAQAGATLSIPLYTAGETRRKKTVATEELSIAQNNLESARLAIRQDLYNAFSDYESQRELWQLEQQNNQLAREHMDICLQRLRLGQTTSLEVHQSQENYAQSSTRLILFRYNLKMAETRVKQMMAEL